MVAAEDLIAHENSRGVQTLAAHVTHQALAMPHGCPGAENLKETRRSATMKTLTSQRRKKKKKMSRDAKPGRS